MPSRFDAVGAPSVHEETAARDRQESRDFSLFTACEGRRKRCPKGANTTQPRAPPWGHVDHPSPSLVRATHSLTLARRERVAEGRVRGEGGGVQRGLATANSPGAAGDGVQRGLATGNAPGGSGGAVKRGLATANWQMAIHQRSWFRGGRSESPASAGRQPG